MTGVPRRLVLGAGAAGLLMASASARRDDQTRLFEWTFLASRDPDPAALARFISLNWFAIDAIAVRQGLLTSYALQIAEAPGEWNVVVMVGYRDARGYDGIATAFEAIRAKHVTITVDGKILKDLGTIVGSRRLRPFMTETQA